MSKKDFQLIADTIAGLNIPKRHRKEVAGRFALALSGTNDGFNKKRFLKACEVL